MKQRSTILIIIWIALSIFLVTLYLYRPSSGSSQQKQESGNNRAGVANFRGPGATPLKIVLPTYVRIDPTPTPVPKFATISVEAASPMHIVFSTDCTFFQDWQTLLVFHSAGVVKQNSPITRIASGCNEKKQKELRELYQKLYPQHHVHFTPDFKHDGKTNKKYDFYNKPYGMEHWLDNADPPIPDGVVIALIDPDFIFLRRLTPDVLSGNNIIQFTPQHSGSHQDQENAQFVKKAGIVRRGHPAAARYGLGAPWAQEHSRNFNKTHVCGANSPCLNVSVPFGENHYSVGPPYILEKSDMLRLTKSWTKFVPRVYEKYPELLAEMYAYSMAAAHVDLPHLTMEHFMVSNPDMHPGEGWKFIDAFQDDVCQPPVEGIYYPDQPLPTFLHYCQFFRIGELGFHKRRILPREFMCESPLFIEPHLDIGKLDYKNRDGEIVKMGRTQARRNAFMVCVIHRSMNAMILDFKKRMCGSLEFINQNKTLNIVDFKY